MMGVQSLGRGWTSRLSEGWGCGLGFGRPDWRRGVGGSGCGLMGGKRGFWS